MTLPEWLTPIVSRHLDTYVDRFPLSKLFSPARGDGYVSTATWGRILHKAMKSAGITTPMHWHDLRHFFGSTLAARGVGIKQLQGALGHATARASLIYLEPVNGMSADVADLMPKPSDSETKTVPFPTQERKQA
ncbi:MAG: site-specific integrase [Bifidobacterium subtile]|nr:site-specific integrase [Bifidobacterium subtile]